MEQIGQVVGIDGDIAMVMVRRHDVCGKCGGCGAAISGGGENYIEAQNIVNAEVGHTVKVTSDTGQVLKASFVVYIVPILALLVGILLGTEIGAVLGLLAREELVGLFFGVIFLLASYFLVRGYDRRMSAARMKISVVEIIEESAGEPPLDEKC
jgi:sigma-E factor negative regulatory protein RseC